ncbi:macrocin O-methyltransferase [Chlorella sorokiniana]|uniref:Macrocin O-methyltransferase n=1 Tax=Chlorella sorokiniana TaxID=3076 RepID=A0A2P6U3V6_CHLSO|nr:macrocin O-methyltransferase [Chlorella sorokiniana]|eukprot:PRW60986.1 macrocin O-methyltransferase [Chlorella sorokiniana]
MCTLLFALFSGTTTQLSGVRCGLDWSAPSQPQRVQSSSMLTGDERLRDHYLDSVRDSILGLHLATPSIKPVLNNDLKQMPFDAFQRQRGGDWPAYGLSMIGRMRMDNLRALLEDVLDCGVPGSFVGKCGLPPNTTAADSREWSQSDFLRVPKSEVQSAFERFGLLDERVHFHKGFFRHALPAWWAQDKSPIAVLRLDGDMYESTMDELYNLWESISPGGYVIIDDWNIRVCRKAVTEFLARNKLDYKVTKIDEWGAWFQKLDATPIDHSWYQQFNGSRTSDDVKSGRR